MSWLRCLALVTLFAFASISHADAQPPRAASTQRSSRSFLTRVRGALGRATQSHVTSQTHDTTVERAPRVVATPRLRLTLPQRVSLAARLMVGKTLQLVGGIAYGAGGVFARVGGFTLLLAVVFPHHGSGVADLAINGTMYGLGATFAGGAAVHVGNWIAPSNERVQLRSLED